MVRSSSGQFHGIGHGDEISFRLHDRSKASPRLFRHRAEPDGMVNLALMDRVLSVDPVTMRVRVQAGARVAEVVDALRPHGLTLQNYASIREQQIGGFIQVAVETLPP